MPPVGLERYSMTMVLTRYHFVVAYFAAMNLFAFTNLFLVGRRMSSLVLLPMVFGSAFLTARYLVRLVGGRSFVPYVDVCVLAYFFYSLLSLAFFLQPSNPASFVAYQYGVNLHILPMLMYFTVKEFSAVDVRRLLRVIVVLHAAFAAIGIVLFFVRPDFYTAHLNDMLGVTETWQVYGRLQSYWGSTATGILSALTIVLIADIGVKPLIRYSLLALFLATIFLAQQRGAYVSGALATAYFLYREKLGLPYVVMVLVGLAVGLIALLNYLDVPLDFVFTIVNNRVVDGLFTESALAERAVSYEKGLAFLADFPLGLGLGATTSAADDAGAHAGGQVVDANFMRIAADLGVLGLLLFFVLLAVAALVASRSSRVRGIAVVILIFVVQATGTNVLDAYYVSHVFWTLLGLLDGRMPARAEEVRGYPSLATGRQS